MSCFIISYPVRYNYKYLLQVLIVFIYRNNVLLCSFTHLLLNVVKAERETKYSKYSKSYYVWQNPRIEGICWGINYRFSFYYIKFKLQGSSQSKRFAIEDEISSSSLFPLNGSTNFSNYLTFPTSGYLHALLHKQYKLKDHKTTEFRFSYPLFNPPTSINVQKYFHSKTNTKILNILGILKNKP